VKEWLERFGIETTHEERVEIDREIETELKKGEIYKESVRLSLAGWDGYARMANTFKLRSKVKARIEHLLNEHGL
jgi:hypothetical protein